MTAAPIAPAVGHHATVGLGSNLGAREQMLIRAAQSIIALPFIQTFACSSVYATDPVGGPPQPRYLNAVLALRLSPSQSLANHVLANHGRSAISEVWVGGRQRIAAGRHAIEREAIAGFVAARSALLTTV